MRKFNKNLVIKVSSVLFAIILGPAVAFGAGPLTVNLLSAGNFVALSQTGITNTGSHTSVITGNVGSSPITSASMNTVFCSEITGTIYGVDGPAQYVGSGTITCFAGNPPLSNKTLVDNAVLDMATAYNDAAGRTLPTATELGSGNIGGMTLAPGLYKWSTDVSIPTNLTLSGGPDDVWIFQISGNLNVASGGSIPAGVKIALAGGAKSENIFWQVGGATGATLGTYSTFNGNILSAKQIIIQTGAILHGRALAQTQVTLDASKVSTPTTTPVNLPPTITLKGANPFNLNTGNSFVDPMASSTDAEDGDLTSSILVTGVVGTTTPGTYTLTYSVTDSGGLSATTTRSVVVSNPVIPTGAVTFCLVLVDSNNNIATTSSGLPTGSFSINLATTTNISSSTINSKTWLTSTFTPSRPLILASNDSDCVTYSNLPFGNYYYSKVATTTGTGWLSDKYNDQFNTPVNSLSDFFSYSPELFTATTTDDASRNLNSDGSVTLDDVHTIQTIVLSEKSTTTPPVGTTTPPVATTTAGTISGTVYNDLNVSGVKDSGEPGISGFTINLYKGAGWWGPSGNNPVFMSVVTDANGNYSFGTLTPGIYSVEEINKVGWKQDTGDYEMINIANASTTITADFANLSLATTTPPVATTTAGTISGTVYNDLNVSGVKNSGEPGIPGFTINLYTGTGWSGPTNKAPIMTSVSDSNGYYSFENLANGTYSVEEINQALWAQFTGDFNSIVISGGTSMPNNDFGNTAKKKNNNRDNDNHNDKNNGYRGR